MTPTVTFELQQMFDLYGLAWASRDPDRIAAYHAEDGIFRLHGADTQDVLGRPAVREAFAGFIASWPDITFEPLRVRHGSDFYVVEWELSGTPAGGSRVACDAIDVIAWDGDLIARKDTYIDAQTLAAQLA